MNNIMNLETSCLEEGKTTSFKSGADLDLQSVSTRFTSLEQIFGNSGQEIRRVLSFYDRLHFKSEDFT